MNRVLGSAVFGLSWRLAAFVASAAIFWSAFSTPPVYVVPAPPVAPVPEAATSSPDQGKTGNAGPSAYGAIRERPLFHQGRRPWTPRPAPPPPPPEEEVPPPSLSGYRLVGLVLSGESRSALIKSPSDENTILLAEGQTLDGWKLEEVSEDKLRFVSGDQIYEMAIPHPKEGLR